MNKMEYKIVPENKEDNENIQKAMNIIEERNKEIAKLFGMEPKNPSVEFHHTSSTISKKLMAQEKEFKGYVDNSQEILILHPDAGNGFFTDLWKEISAISDYALVKYYFCQKYYPESKDFKLYYKHLSEYLASVVSGKYQESIARFELKIYVKGKKIKKDKLIGMILYLMREYSGTDFIFKNLDTIVEQQDIEKSLQTIYGKTVDDWFIPEKEKIIEEDRKKQELERERRRALMQEQKKNTPARPQKKYISKDKYKPQENKKETNKN